MKTSLTAIAVISALCIVITTTILGFILRVDTSKVETLESTIVRMRSDSTKSAEDIEKLNMLLYGPAKPLKEQERRARFGPREDDVHDQLMYQLERDAELY